jgi:hypothetical protein
MDVPQDDFKWFGEGFDGFPKRLPEDVVEYIVFIIDAKLSDTKTRERLQAFQRALAGLEKKFLNEYIWQRDSIKLDLIRDEGRWLLKGTTNYGDSVADEWLVVYLLRELSREFRDAWIRIHDTDGEFLLIEAANALPRWLNPEVAENRVWINNHRLLIVPLAKDETPGPLKQANALSIFFNAPARPQHYSKVEKEAFHRLTGYPGAISENQHHASLPLPRRVAYILHANPSYIAPAVEAFYLRDPISLRYLQPDKSPFPLLFPPEDWVNVSVRFTKVLYAQLLGQHWEPPGAFETALEQLQKDNNPQEKAEISVKVTAGLEMLLKHKIYADKKAVREIGLLLEDLDTGDDSLPTDAELATWPKREDNEAWLNIDFAEFERELAGKGGDSGFGDKAAQENLKKMVDRFNAFMVDEDAGLEGADGLDPMDVDNDSDDGNRDWEDPDISDTESSQEAERRADDDDQDEDDDHADAEYAEYEKAYEKYMTLPAAEKAFLTDEARALALAEETEREEDDEIKQLSEMMEAELFGYGALDLNPKDKQIKGQKDILTSKGKGKAKLEGIQEEEVESDDEALDEDYNLAENMLKAFKGQGGMAGPAGNLMGMMGVQFPLDADDEQQRIKKAKGKAPVR